MYKDLFLIKSKNIPAIIAVVLSSFGIFFVSQYAVLISVGLVFGLIGKSSDEALDIFASDSYWPKVFVYALIASAMVYLVFRALGVWDGIKTKHAKPAKKRLAAQLALLKLKQRPSPAELLDVFATYGLYMVAVTIVGIAVTASGLINVDQAQELGVDAPQTLSALLATFVIFVVLPPISEEILFRGYLYNKLAIYSGAGISYILTCVLFGIAHLEYGNLNWIAAVDTLVFSAFLIYISQKHQSLYSAILLHALKNFVAFLLFAYGAF
jgi:membrane protease YdiL (CAAX protease family)